MKDIKGFEGLYAVTKSGRVWSYLKLNSPFVTNKGNKWLRGYVMKNGYLTYHLRIKEKNFNKFAHRIVAETFIPNPKNAKTVNHRNFNKLDNRVSNLEWCSLQENLKHRDAHNRLPSGERHHASYLSEEEIRNIRNINKFKKYTRREIALAFDIPIGTVKNILTRRTWKHVI